jgi:hypothetical protein
VRGSHRLLQGVLVQWSDPPSPEALFHERSYGHYHAGNTFNCRCYPAPVLNLNTLVWPHRVYAGGAIRMMTLVRFKEMFQIQSVPLAA